MFSITRAQTLMLYCRLGQCLYGVGCDPVLEGSTPERHFFLCRSFAELCMVVVLVHWFPRGPWPLASNERLANHTQMTGWGREARLPNGRIFDMLLGIADLMLHFPSLDLRGVQHGEC